MKILCSYCRRSNDEKNECCSGCGAVLPEKPSMIQCRVPEKEFNSMLDIARKAVGLPVSNYPLPSGSTCQFEE